MNALNRIALLAGGALVAAAATGCSSSTAKPAASGAPGAPANSSTAPGVLSATSSAPGAVSSSSPSGAAAPSADASDPPAANVPPTTAPKAPPTIAPAAAPKAHPVCANADLNASLAPAGSGWKSSVYVIAVKNAGPTCTVRPIPYVWISAGPGDTPDSTRPMVPDTSGGQPQIILSGTTLYSAIDLDPISAANAVAGYTYLDVTANPTPDSSGKDVQDVKLSAPAKVSGAMLSVYATSPAGAIGQIQYATTPEK